MVEATEMLKFLGTLKDLKNSSITIICDRGYMSEDNVQRMDDASLNFLLMLKSNMNVTKDLLNDYSGLSAHAPTHDRRMENAVQHTLNAV